MNMRENLSDVLSNFGADEELVQIIRNPEAYLYDNLTCEDTDRHVGEVLRNAFGGEFEIIQVSEGTEASRSENELVCLADSLINPQGPTELEIRYFVQDGQYLYNIQML